MKTLWGGNQKGKLNGEAYSFNSSIAFDCVMYRSDIKASIAHSQMLCEQGIISEEDCTAITMGLFSIMNDIDSGKLEIDQSAEDIHTFVESELTSRIGDAGKRLHTARSRNDQTALDLRLHLRGECGEIEELVKEVIAAILKLAEANTETVMPGYTHMQRAQPITFAQHILAYAFMLKRDLSRLDDCKKRMNYSPLGSAALAGTTFDIDRRRTADLLGFSGICENSIDGVSDRDFVIELSACLSIIMAHLSRFCEEIILWCGAEFSFIELPDEFSTGSSIMPQKKNPDIAELIRGKTGRVYGGLMTLLTMLKGLPLAYNKDMQEDKEAIFDSVCTVKQCLSVFAAMLSQVKAKPENMRKAAAEGFINATDCADYLVGKDLPFRDAYRIVGDIVAHCIDKGYTLENMPLDEYKSFSPLFGEDLYGKINLEACVYNRRSEGGTSPTSVKIQIEALKSSIFAISV